MQVPIQGHFLGGRIARKIPRDCPLVLHLVRKSTSHQSILKGLRPAARAHLPRAGSIGGELDLYLTNDGPEDAIRLL